MPFETFGFATNYTVELNPEQPGVGWGDRTRVIVRPGVNDAVIAEVTPVDGLSWLAVDGMLPSDPPWAYATPNPDVIFAATGQYGFDGDLIDVNRGRSIRHLEIYEPRVHGFPELGLLLLASSTDIVAIGVDGVAWESGRVAEDNLVILRAGSDVIECEGHLGDGHPVRVTIDPVTGRQLSGPVFWRPSQRRSGLSRLFRRKSK